MTDADLSQRVVALEVRYQDLHADLVDVKADMRTVQVQLGKLERKQDQMLSAVATLKYVFGIAIAVGPTAAVIAARLLG